ncbi:MAG: hypothetical protein FWC64_03630 [Treponema sp.]|nr:hypothetical protein [Treponema sp.]
MNKALPFAFLASAFLMFAFLAPSALNAHDFGMILNQSGGISSVGSDSPDIDYEAALVPRFSALFGDTGELFVSASATVLYEDDAWSFVPEILRSEFSWSLGDTEFRIGRMVYSDPLQIVAAGLFDGVQLSHHTTAGTFGLGLWYTGLLYRNRANIAMTADDRESLGRELNRNWSNFGDVYFASRRAVAALYWEHPSLAELLRLDVALIGQADLNRRRDRAYHYHSQYLLANIALPFQRFIFGLGGALEAAQTVNNNSTDVSIALAGDFGVHWIPPAPFYSMLSLTGRFTSPAGSSTSAFTPITALTYGDVLEAEIPGISVLSLGYSARLYRTLSAALTVSCFIRMDTETYAFPSLGETAGGGGGRILGTEIFGRVVWSPVSDMSLNVGAGAFLPSFGDVAPSANPRWRIEMAITLALL